MKRRGFFSRLLGLASVPILPALPVAKENPKGRWVETNNYTCVNGRCMPILEFVAHYPCGDGVSCASVTIVKNI